MKRKIALSAVAVFGLLGIAFAQQKGAPPPPQPALAACGTSGEAEILCGTRSPEDLELTPDGKSLIVSQFVNNRGAAGEGAGLSLFDPVKKTFTKIAMNDEPLKDWGDSSCPGPIGANLAPHGTSLVKRSNGKWQLFVVNHGGRESIEMYELKQTAGSWTLTWHGCVAVKEAYNDVAALPDGGYIATHPTALQAKAPPAQAKGDAKAKGPQTDIFGGQVSGYVSRWAAGKGETELPGTRSAYPNGVVASSDGRFIYFNAWTASEVHKYDLRAGKETGVVKLTFMPDNLTWTKEHELLAAGVKGARGDCPPGSGSPCIQGFGVSVIDTGKMTAKTVFDSAGKAPLISGVSVALQMGNAVYIGSFQGDRIVKVNWKE